MLGSFGALHSNIENAARMEAMIASQTNWGSGFGGVADDFSKVINSLSQAVVQTVPALKGQKTSTPPPSSPPSGGGGGGGGGGGSKTWLYVGGAVALGVVGVLVYKKMKKRR